MNGPMTDATYYRRIADFLRKLGYAASPDRTTLTGIVVKMGDSALQEWYEKEWRDGTDVVLMVDFHLLEDGDG